ncbi:MAG TPA: cupin-like domain-containing protein [Kofleriaceae bacterium]|nr:cupin-like domain-containing protein [Kofleriaceae bacterium]
MDAPSAYDEIDRRRDLAWDELRDYLRLGRPVVIAGGAQSWRERWTPESLKARFGTHRIWVETKEPNPQLRRRLQISMAELIDSVLANSLEYRLRGHDFLSFIPELEQEFLENRFFPQFFDGPAVSQNLWISPRGNQSSFHHDANVDNLNVQIYGRKLFVLASPASYRNLYPQSFGYSPVRVFEPNPEYARFAQARPLQTLLEPGDILFIPQYWWHWVRALEPSINVNVWNRRYGAAVVHGTTGVPALPRALFLMDAFLEQRVPWARVAWARLARLRARVEAWRLGQRRNAADAADAG